MSRTQTVVVTRVVRTGATSARIAVNFGASLPAGIMLQSQYDPDADGKVISAVSADTATNASALGGIAAANVLAFAQQGFQTVVNGNPATTQYALLCTLPDSTNTGNFDKTTLEVIGGQWGSSDLRRDLFMFGNRGGFARRWEVYGSGTTPLRLQVYVNANVASVYLVGAASQFQAWMVRDAQITDATNTPHLGPAKPLSVGAWSGTAPTGTLVFDTNAATPDLQVDSTGLRVNGTLIGSGRTTVTDAPATLTTAYNGSTLTLPGAGYYDLTGAYYVRQTAGSLTTTITPTFFANATNSQAGTGWAQTASSPNATSVTLRGWLYWDGTSAYAGEVDITTHIVGSGAIGLVSVAANRITFNLTGVGTAPALKLALGAPSVNTAQVNGELTVTKL